MYCVSKNPEEDGLFGDISTSQAELANGKGVSQTRHAISALSRSAAQTGQAGDEVTI